MKVVADLEDSPVHNHELGVPGTPIPASSFLTYFLFELNQFLSHLITDQTSLA